MPSGCYIQYVSKSGRPSSGHRTGKGPASSHFPRKVTLKNVLTFKQLHSSPMLLRFCLESYMLGLQHMWTKNFQMSKLGLEKEEELESKLPTFAATTAKLLQSCLTLCDPIDGSPPDSAGPGILQARTLEWVVISFSNAWKWKVKSENEVTESCPTLSDSMDCSLPGFSVHGIFQARVLEWGAIAFSLYLFWIHLEHLGVHCSHIAEAWLGEFWALLY